jgi:hypothetical protein
MTNKREPIIIKIPNHPKNIRHCFLLVPMANIDVKELVFIAKKENKSSLRIHTKSDHVSWLGNMHTLYHLDNNKYNESYYRLQSMIIFYRLITISFLCGQHFYCYSNTLVPIRNNTIIADVRSLPLLMIISLQ